MILGRPATALFLVIAVLMGVLVALALGGPFGTTHALAPVTVGIDFNTGDNTSTTVGAITTCKEVASGASYTLDVYVQNIAGPASAGMIGGQYTLNTISGNTLTARSVTGGFIDTNPGLNGATPATIDSGASTALPNSTGSDTPVSSNDPAIGGTGATGDGFWLRMTYTAPTVGSPTSVPLSLADITLNDPFANEITVTVVKSAELIIAPGGTTTCANFLATPTPAVTASPAPTTMHFRVHKTWTPSNPGVQVSIGLLCTGATVDSSPKNAAEGAPADFVLSNISGATCTATETVPRGYVADQTDCAGKSPVAGVDIDCTITNTLRRADIPVSKTYSDGTSTAVTVTPNCTSGQTTPAHLVTPGTPFTFVISGFDVGATCSFSESGSPAGYAQSGCQNVPAIDGHFGPNSDACTITNTTSRGFNVTKVFSDGNAATVTVALACDSPASVTNTDTTATGNGGDDANFTVSGFTPGTTTCSATESGQPSGYTPDYTNCTSVLMTVSGSAKTCTITNNATATLTVSKTYACQQFTTASETTTVDPCCQQITAAAGTTTAGACVIINSGITVTGASVTVTPTCPGASVSPLTAPATPGGPDAVFTITGFGANATCTIAESDVPPGYAEDGTDANDTCHSGVGVVANGTPSCNIVNSPSTTTFTINKDWIPNNATGVATFDLVCTDSTGLNPSTGTISGGSVDADTTQITGDNSASFTVAAFSAGDKCSVNENPSTLADGYSLTGLSNPCISATLVNKGTETCDVINQTHAQLIVYKVWDDNSGASVTVDLTCDNDNGTTTSTPPSQTVTPPANSQFTVRGFGAAGDTCHLTENPVPDGYNATYSGCDPTVTPDDFPNSYTCTVTNHVNTETFEVDKVYSDNSTSPGVNVSISCTDSTGIVAVSPDPDTSQPASPGSPATWTITYYEPGNDTCTATEDTGPQGYTPDQTDCANRELLTNTAAQAQADTCTITNTLNQTTWEVDKNYPQNTGPTVSIDITCDLGVVVLGGTPQYVIPNSSNVLTISHFDPGQHCSVNENPTPQGYVKSQVNCTNANLQVNSSPATCVITNTTQETFVVHKDFSDNNTASVSVTLTCPGGGTITNTQNNTATGTVTELAPLTFTDTGFTGTPTCTATESPIPQGYAASGSPAGSCSGGLSATSVTSPGTTTQAVTIQPVSGCTITNTLRSATFNVSKVYSPTGPTDSVNVTVTCPSTSPVRTVTPSAATPVSPGPATAFAVKGFNAGDTCTATESVPDGYTASYSDCVDQTVTDLGTVDCTITNTQNTATFTVKKVYTNVALTAPVTVHIGCSSGTPDDLSGSATPGGPDFVTTIRSFNSSGATCTAYEDIPPGFSESDNCTSVPVAVNGTPSCTITNADTVHFHVFKHFTVPTADQVIISLTCTTGHIVTDDASANDADPADFTITSFQAGATCTAHERVPRDWVSDESDCQNVPILTGNCTIIDTYTPGAPSSSPAPSPSKTASPTPSPTSSPTVSPSPSPSPTPGGPTVTPRATRSGTGAVTPTPTHTASPTPSPTPSPSPTHTGGPQITPRPTRTPNPNGGPFSLTRISRLAQFW